ncbi:MAG: hypothetical protein IKA43_02285 [Clostridia bacterium]|nr:hypothetical protein [Clostridia bacterium]
MKKRLFLMLFILVALVAMLASCGHECEFELKQETPATCEEAGYRVLGCTECDEEKLENIPALGHDYVSTVVPPTCQAQGYTTQKCSRCGDTNNDAKLDFTEKTKHTYVHVDNSKVEPTCTENGYELQKCSACGIERKYNSVEKLGHKFKTTLVPSVLPTCTDAGAGTETRKCEVCGTKDENFTDRPNVEIPALGHDIDKTDDYRTSTTPATCTTSQHDVWSCKREGCAYTEEADVGDPLGHDWTVDAGVKAAATCYSLETRTYNCVRFGQAGCVKTDAQGDVSKVKITADSLLPHTPGAAADCDTAQICTVCESNPLASGLGEACVNDATGVCLCGKDSNKIHVFAAPTGEHDYDVATSKGLQETIAPTCMKRGYSVYLCSGCNKTYNDNYTDIDPDNHNVDYDSMVGDKIVDATCIKFAYSVHGCTNQAENGTFCDYTTEKVQGNEYADHVFTLADPTGVATCTHCQKSFYDTTYVENVYMEYVEIDENDTGEYTKYNRIESYVEATDGDYVYDAGTEKYVPVADGETGTHKLVVKFEESATGNYKLVKWDGSNGTEFDENTKLNVTITVSKSVKEPTVLTNASTSATIVDNANPDTTKITIVRIISDNDDVEFTVTVNGTDYKVTGSAYIDLTKIGDIETLSVASSGEGTYNATVYFYGEDAVPAN